MANQYPRSAVTVNSVGLKTTTTFSYTPSIVTKATSYVLQPSDSGSVFNDTGASSTVTFTLPAQQAGLTFVFVASAAQSCVVTTGAGTAATIKGSTGAGVSGGAAISGNTLTCAAGTAANQWSRVSLESDGTNWVVSNIQGSWAVTTA